MKLVEVPVFFEKDGPAVVFTQPVLPENGEVVDIVLHDPTRKKKAAQIIHLKEGDCRQLLAFLEAVLESYDQQKGTKPK